MKINELKSNSKIINLVGVITHLDEAMETPNEINYQEGILSDDTGQVKLTLWREEIGEFKLNDKIIISTGWCKEFENELQVSSGKFGKMSLVPPEKPEKY